MTVPRRIVQIVTQMEAGGAQRHAIENARIFRRRDLEVETWFFYRKRPVFDDEPGVRVLMSERPRGVRGLLRLLAVLWTGLRDAAPAAVITYSHYANVIGCVVAALGGVSRRVANQTGLPRRVPVLARGVDVLWGCLGVYSRVIANSGTTLKALSANPTPYRRRLGTVPHGAFAPPTRNGRDSARRALAAGPGDFVVLTVGRLAEAKNHPRLIAAVGRIPGIRLLVVGDGENRAAITECIHKHDLAARVSLLGEVHPDHLGDLFAAADAFVLPSLWESFGIAVLEAASAGLPLAASDIPVLRETLGAPEAGNAVFFDPLRVESIEKALRRLRDDPVLRADLGGRARALAAPYSMEAMADGFLKAVWPDA